MALSEMLRILIFLNIFSSVLSCGGGGPSPCSWTTCKHEWRNDWSPGITTGQCTQQRRNAHHITQSHGGMGSCPSPTHCSPSTQYRTKCSCRNAYYCPFFAWSSWSGSVSAGTCGRQSRYRDYNQHTRYDIRDNNCHGISISCGSRQYNYRNWCSCRYAKCTLGSWSSWTDTASPVSSAHCASQRRTRSYFLSWLYTERLDNCNGIQPHSCPSAHEETREKVVMCPALPKPSHGSWHRDDCNAKSQVCRSVCLLRCDTVNGFQLEGPDRRECLATGQWSTPWSSYCKEICEPGEFMKQEASGIINCLMCPIGTYQPKFRATKCEACPAGKTTLQKASTSINDCQ